MTHRTPQQHAANIINAVGHLLVDAPGRQEEVDRNLAIMVAGAPVDTLNLLNWADWVRRSERDIIHFSFPEEHPPVPIVSMVVVNDADQAIILESCMLWLPQSGGRCWIIPDGDGWGAYRLDADLRLKHYERPPVRRGKAAVAGYIRAYERLAAIAQAQLASGEELPLPIHIPAKAA
jgi:hypothetical protein